MAKLTRRQLLIAGPALLALPAAGAAGPARLSLNESLGQQHGIVSALLLVYESMRQQIDAGARVDLSIVGDACRLVREFVEDYHERTVEEVLVFEELYRQGLLKDTLHELRVQHGRSRLITDSIAAATASGAADQIAPLIRKFVAMYIAHASWEDVHVFPALQAHVSRRKYAELSERLAEEERKQFGKAGLSEVIKSATALMARAGIDSLAHFTPAP